MKGPKPIKKPKAKKAKAKKANVKKVNATTRSTGGPGFNFEDNVSAWLLLKMLCGESIPGIEASGFQLQLQTTALGWNIDDLLVTATSHDAEKRQLAISSKSNVQVKSSGFPSSFIISAWSLWQKSHLFKREQDGIALATRGYDAAFNSTWQDLKDWCKDGDTVSALAKINATQKHRKFFDSIKKPLTSDGASINYEDLEDDDENSHTLDTFGYILLENLARIASLLPANETINIWKPLFELGANAHYAIRHFLDAWFVQFSRQGNSPIILQTWKNMLEYALGSEKWISGRRWYYGEQLLRQLLGMNSEAFLIREDRQSVVLALKDYYKQWALKHLSREEDNITAFCRFLGSKAGAVIRMEGIVWLKESLTGDARSSYGRRDHAGNALVELFDTAINENAKQIAENPEVREALVSLVADLVAKQIPAALALQERIRRIVP